MLNRLKSESLTVESVEDIVGVRRQARHMAVKIGFGLADQTRLATAVSELARNCLQYAGGGACEIHDLSSEQVRVVRVIIVDSGPGIADIDAAMRDGFTTGNGLGAGLPGCRRLMDEFYIDSKVGHGTKVWAEIHAAT